MSTGPKTAVITAVFMATGFGVYAPTIAQSEFEKVVIKLPMGVLVINANSILQANPPSEKQEGSAKFVMYVTAYSSSVDETDSTPFITASGTKTRDGVVATNLFPFGTRVRIPELFGSKVFVVEDRMHRRFSDRLDIWMPSKWEALQFGKKLSEVHVVEL